MNVDVDVDEITSKLKAIRFMCEENKSVWHEKKRKLLQSTSTTDNFKEEEVFSLNSKGE